MPARVSSAWLYVIPHTLAMIATMVYPRTARNNLALVPSSEREKNGSRCGFRNMKSDLEALPMGVHGDETMQGYLLVQFIALIMEFEIRRRMRGSAIRGTMSMREMLMEMSKFRMVRQGDSKVLTEITKKQRGILEAMSIKEKDLVIN